ncbi:hypothetical protein [Nocardia abscessus]|uniref:hypothetical protein n=1 Tax=Nocardia abscessus TaxID=120957 RepID=UPI00245775FD|nr:hypothetical protein [Nocardia abscessus]
MKPDSEYEKGARPGRPFSNTTEWEIWNFNECEGGGNDARRCVNDDGEDCPLILIALTERTPAEWTGTHGRYSCSEKVTPAQKRAADREAQRAAEAAERAAIEAQHYGTLFDVGEVGP